MEEGQAIESGGKGGREGGREERGGREGGREGGRGGRDTGRRREEEMFRLCKLKLDINLTMMQLPCVAECAPRVAYPPAMESMMAAAQ